MTTVKTKQRLELLALVAGLLFLLTALFREESRTVNICVGVMFLVVSISSHQKKDG